MQSKVMQSRLKFYDGLVVDNFAGGGGASTGIELALSRPVDVAINHDEDAIAMHQVNHPFTKHFCESVWDIDPRKVANGQEVMLAWFSPDCTHFSKARGCKPAEKNIRGLAWVSARWAATVKPQVIILENVEEFKTWGPLGKDGYPIKEKSGKTFDRFVNTLRDQGYDVDWRELRACDYGAPTIRKRFFLIARRDGLPITWPTPTHGPDKLPFRTAAEIIDWSLPCPSIFATSEEIREKYGIRANRPLAEATLRRIARGLQKFIIENPKPYIVPWTLSNTSNSFGRTVDEPVGTATTATGGGQMLVTPYITSIGQTGFSVDRSRSIDTPLNTVVSKAEQCLIAPTLVQYPEEVPNHHREVVAFLSKHYSGGYKGKGSSLVSPLGTVTAIDHNSLVAASVVKFKGDNIGQPADEPLQTICAGAIQFAEVRAFLSKYCGDGSENAGIISLNGSQYAISDIGMRMLSPRELFNAQGFPPDYVIDIGVNGKPATKKAQVARCGNSVCPSIAEALVRANLSEYCGRKIGTMADLEREYVAV